MDFFDILLAKKLENDKDVSIVQLNVSENGTYSESGKAYSPVVVDVQPPSNSYLRTPIASYPATAQQLPIPKCDVTITNQKYCQVLVSDKPFVNNKSPYIYRASAGGDRVYEKLIGGTIAWNQLVQNADTSCTIPILRKYIARIGDTWSIGISDGTAITVDGSIRDMVFDLTQMFGTTIADYIYSLEQATAGAGVAWFRTLFPNDYYAYDSGTLQSVNVASKKVVGFNQWDEEWENGGIDSSTGSNTTASGIRTKNFIPLIPNVTYYNKFGNTSGGANFQVRFYDANKTYIGYRNQSGGTINKNAVIEPPVNARYMRFQVQDAYGTSYNHDICINISNPSKNGTYEPYEEHTYAFDSDLTLRGIPKLDANNNLYYDGDVYESDGTVTRKYGIVDLGSLNWLPNSAQTGRFDSDSLTSLKAVGETNILCALYTTTTSSRMPSQNMVIRGSTVNSNIVIVNTAFAGYTNTQVQNALSGVYLVYELATPTTESADTYINPQMVDADGTEEFVDYGVEQETRDVAVPVGHDSLYYNGQIYQTNFEEATTGTINMAELYSIVPPSGEFYMTANGTLSVDVWKK